MTSESKDTTSRTSRKRGAPDETLIDLAAQTERERWAKKLGVTVDELEAAVKAVGPNAEAVERRLRGRSQSSRSA